MTIGEIIPWIVWLIVGAVFMYSIGYSIPFARLILKQMTFEERLVAFIILWLMITASVYAVVALSRYL